MKTTVTAALVAATLAACTSTGNGTRPDPTTAYVQALEAQDVEALMGLYHEDARWYVDGRLVLDGSEEMRGGHEYRKRLGSEQFIVGCEEHDDRIVLNVQEQAALYQVLGVDSVSQTVEFKLVGDRVQAVNTTYDRDDMQQLGSVLSVFLQWVSEAHPESFAAFFAQPGHVRMTGDNGARMLELAREWRNGYRGQG